MQTADPPSLYNFETARLDDEMVKIEDVTIWIDPLDATQEYTGQAACHVSLFLYQMHCPNRFINILVNHWICLCGLNTIAFSS